MSCQDDVLRIGKKLEKMISNKAEDPAVALDMLNTLKRLPMTLDVLQKTRIGMTVNNFRKSTKNDEVITLSKSLIKVWKKLLSEGSNGSQSSSLSRSSSVASNMSRDGDDSRDSSEAPSAAGSEEKRDGSGKADDGDDKASGGSGGGSEHPPGLALFALKANDTADPIRLKCREMLTKALQTELVAVSTNTTPVVTVEKAVPAMTPAPEPALPSTSCTANSLPDTFPDGGHNPADVAASIEDCIFNEFRNTEAKYKNRIRSRVSNLKDVKNPQLRENVLCGTIKPEKIAIMSSIEMANDAMKSLRAEYTKQAINDHQLSVTSGTITDLLKCGKCQKRKCAYNQVQTRSADEPMTTFVLCLECGHRWKFC